MHLPAIQTTEQNYTLLQLDQAPYWAELLGLDLDEATSVSQVEALIDTANQVLGPSFSGIVLDPIYTFALAEKHPVSAGLLFRLSTLRAGVDPLAIPQLLPDWGVAEIANNYGLAKLELYYHPAEERALEKKQLMAELYDYCKYQHIDLLLKLVVYTPAEQEFDKGQFQADQLQAIQEFHSSADIMALQFPLDPLPTATVTAELDIPWILFTQDQGYDQFKQDFRVCLENGAQGFMLDHNFFKKMNDLRKKDSSPDWEQLEELLRTTLRDRVIELKRIVTEGV